MPSEEPAQARIRCAPGGVEATRTNVMNGRRQPVELPLSAPGARRLCSSSRHRPPRAASADEPGVLARMWTVRATLRTSAAVTVRSPSPEVPHLPPPLPSRFAAAMFSVLVAMIRRLVLF